MKIFSPLYLLLALLIQAEELPKTFDGFIPENRVSSKAQPGKLRIIFTGNEGHGRFRDVILQMKARKLLPEEPAFLDVGSGVNFYFGVDIDAGDNAEKTIKLFLKGMGTLEEGLFDGMLLNMVIFDETSNIRFIYLFLFK